MDRVPDPARDPLPYLVEIDPVPALSALHPGGPPREANAAGSAQTPAGQEDSVAWEIYADGQRMTFFRTARSAPTRCSVMSHSSTRPLNMLQPCESYVADFPEKFDPALRAGKEKG